MYDTSDHYPKNKSQISLMEHLLYIDPGSGSYLVQVLIGAVLGFIMFFKNIKLYILSFFRRSPKKQKDE